MKGKTEQRKLTVDNEDVTRMLFLNTVPLTVEASVTGAVKSVHPG
jgi:hypothetical protein